ncbi:hypothetical protein [Marinoscillum sp.]|uniref:hypothetical protein n=1 Tax=Marinoscillum sp. TaxID=2024838 RepID=UPI003BA924A2
MKLYFGILLILVVTTGVIGQGNQDMTFDNSRYIYFENNSGQNDGVSIGRYGGNALRIKYKLGPIVFDALDDKPFQITNSASQTKILFHPDGDSYLNGGNVGIGTSPEVKLHIKDGAVDVASSNNFDSNLMIQATSSSRSMLEGASLGFAVPANTDGGNSWQQGRIIVTPDNETNARAEGRMLLQTRYLNSGSWQWRDNLVLRSNGRVGVGVKAPESMLHVAGAGSSSSGLKLSNGNNAQFNMYMVDNSGTSDVILTRVGTGGAEMRMLPNGDVVLAEKGGVSVGTRDLPSGYKLSVDGKAIMEEVKVELSGSWPDYVFSPGYQLRSLEETKAFIDQNHRLPNMPSAKEVAEEGISLGEMNAKLLEKIEELTLLLIEERKSRLAREEELTKRIEELEKQ